MQDTPVSLFKRAFPKAYLSAKYRTMLTKHITDLDLWSQVLADERTDRRRVRVPWLIKEYQKMELTIREIETPSDRLATHRTPEAIEPGRQMSPAALKDLLGSIPWHKPGEV